MKNRAMVIKRKKEKRQKCVKNVFYNINIAHNNPGSQNNYINITEK